MATGGKSTAGRFYGFRLHTVISDKGEIFDSVFTRAKAFRPY
ncbi:MAG: transposase [Tannerella sp.]|nr:transposase [Tannerella sp.]